MRFLFPVARSGAERGACLGLQRSPVVPAASGVGCDGNQTIENAAHFACRAKVLGDPVDSGLVEREVDPLCLAPDAHADARLRRVDVAALGTPPPGLGRRRLPVAAVVVGLGGL